jgi:hypothetical protein
LNNQKYVLGLGESVKKTIYHNGGNGLLRDRAPWAVFHIRFDKHPDKPLRLRYVHRGYSCGRNVVAVSGVGGAKICYCPRRPGNDQGREPRRYAMLGRTVRRGFPCEQEIV